MKLNNLRKGIGTIAGQWSALYDRGDWLSAAGGAVDGVGDSPVAWSLESGMDKDDDGLPRSYRWNEKLDDWNDAIHKREDNLGFWLGVLFVSPVLTSLQWLNRKFSNWSDDQWEKRRVKRDARFEEWRRRHKR